MKIAVFFVSCVLTATFALAQKSGTPPNIIIIYADDLGYGDLSCFGHPTIRTPNLDQMAAEGMRFTQFYVAADVCSPSRAALLTGRLPLRIGIVGHQHDVFFPNSAGGLPESELTIANFLKDKNYQTGIIGKWHLGHLPQYLPPNHGFDYYFGIPYSNDMIPRPNNNNPPLPLFRNMEVIERGPDQSQLTKRYTEEAVAFIRKNKNKPFFLYYPNNAPHTPLHPSADFKGSSKRGLYGDVVQELDWSVGVVLRTLKELKLDKNTLVVFASDNGPWLLRKQDGGSAGLLFEGKGSTYEGGMRVPFIAWWPGKIKAGQINTSLATTMDILPTVLKLAGATLPTDRKYDGMDIMPLLTGQQKEVRKFVYYYHLDQLHAIRMGPWKAHFTTKPSYSKEPAVIHETPLLFNLEVDPSEKYDVSKEHPDILQEIIRERDNHVAGMVPGPPQLDRIIGQ